MLIGQQVREVSIAELAGVSQGRLPGFPKRPSGASHLPDALDDPPGFSLKLPGPLELIADQTGRSGDQVRKRVLQGADLSQSRLFHVFELIAQFRQLSGEFADGGDLMADLGDLIGNDGGPLDHPRDRPQDGIGRGSGDSHDQGHHQK